MILAAGCVLVDVVDGKGFALNFASHPEIIDLYLVRRPLRLTSEMKKVIQEDYFKRVQKPLPLAWQ